MAQSPTLPGDFILLQGGKSAGNSEHLAAFETVNDCVVHAPSERGADGGTGEIP
jgi:hypothetical protein